MSSRFLSLALLLATASNARVLRVCADPNNMPFSNEAGQGFENRIAELIARDLNAKLEFVWWPERKSFIKKSLNANLCDVVMGVPTSLDSVLATRPYYRSTYVFVTRSDRGLHVSALSDPRLSQWKIGIHVVGDDYAPPAHALARRGLSANLVGYGLFGAFGEPNPPAKLIDAVTHGDVDVAIVWGPFAGYFGNGEKQRLDITPVTPSMYLAVPFTYDISAAVRLGDDALRNDVQRAFTDRCSAIQSLLVEYGVPKAPEGNPQCESLSSQSSPASSR